MVVCNSRPCFGNYKGENPCFRCDSIISPPNPPNHRTRQKYPRSFQPHSSHARSLGKVRTGIYPVYQCVHPKSTPSPCTPVVDHLLITQSPRLPRTPPPQQLSWLGPPSNSLSARGTAKRSTEKLMARGSPTQSGGGEHQGLGLRCPTRR